MEPVSQTYKIEKMDSIIDVPGVSVGSVSDTTAGTGCTVVLFDSPSVGALDLRGGGTSTRQIDSMLPNGTYGRINAILLTGGSAFGLNAAEGVMKYLEENNTGLDVGYGFVVPSVPTAVIFDLGIGDGNVRPYAEMAYQACLNASSVRVEQGNSGAGTGATVGKITGISYATKSGAGTASHRFDDGINVGVYVVVNAWGDVYSPSDGRIIAGARSENGCPVYRDTVKMIKEGFKPKYKQNTNTTLVVVVTDALLDKTELMRVSTIAQNGLSRVIAPVNTVADGDLVFAVSTGLKKGDANSIGIVASDLVTRSVIRAIDAATGILGIPSAGDIRCDRD